MNNILFIGTYQRKVDSKGRLSIPAGWRKYLTENAIYCYILKQSLKCRISIEDIKVGYPRDDYDFKTKMLPNVIKYNCDPEGRVIIKSQIDKTATLKGCGDHFTIQFLD